MGVLRDAAKRIGGARHDRVETLIKGGFLGLAGRESIGYQDLGFLDGGRHRDVVDERCLGTRRNVLKVKKVQCH